jgi:hypothetical protein
MAYVLCALIAEFDILRGAEGFTMVPLPQGKGLVPLVKGVWNEPVSQPMLREWEGRNAPDEEFESPEERRSYIERAAAAFAWIASRCARLSSAPGAAVAYVEADFWGGSGRQAAAVWAGGALVLGPFVGGEAINEALARIGVLPGASGEPFAALGLGRCRSTEAWLDLVETPA